ncbi:MAG TPA: hypothetical protein VMF69_10045, partial [Gemmataceae bacterium]|nr:hypothetical protein [Gemmataceae bacterium]
MKRSLVTISLLVWLCLALSAREAAKPMSVEIWPAKVPDETGDIGPEKVRMSPKLTKKEVEVTASTK